MQEKGWHVHARSFLSMNGWENLYKGNIAVRLISILQGFLRRILHVAQVAQYDIVLIHREVTPMGPPVFEFIITKLLRKPILYDFDDAIWLPDPNETNWLSKTLKWKSKVKYICKWSWKISAGNEYLANYAQQYNSRVEIIPTVVDTSYHLPTTSKKSSLTIGWTGSHTTLQYLNPLVPIINRITKKYSVRFMVIANKNPELPIQNFQFTQWSKDREIDDLQQFDIGIMPLTDDIWSKGKCGFKAIQYGALGIPALVSPVGVNVNVVQHEVSGFLCEDLKDWESSLEKLITSEKLCQEMGAAGRAHVIKHYSIESVREKFLSLFKK